MDSDDSCVLYCCKRCKGVMFSRDEFLKHSEICEGLVENSNCTHFLCEKESLMQLQKNETASSQFEITNKEKQQEELQEKKRKRQDNAEECSASSEITLSVNKRPRCAASQKLLANWEMCESGDITAENSVNVDGSSQLLDKEHHSNEENWTQDTGYIDSEDANQSAEKETFDSNICVKEEKNDLSNSSGLNESNSSECVESNENIHLDTAIYETDNNIGNIDNTDMDILGQDCVDVKVEINVPPENMECSVGEMTSEKSCSDIDSDDGNDHTCEGQKDIIEDNICTISNSDNTRSSFKKSDNDQLHESVTNIPTKRLPSKEVLAFLKSCKSKQRAETLTKKNNVSATPNGALTKSERKRLKIKYHPYFVEDYGGDVESGNQGIYQCPKCPFGCKKLGIFHRHFTSAHEKPEETSAICGTEEQNAEIINLKQENDEAIVDNVKTEAESSHGTAPKSSTEKISNRQLYNKLRAGWVKEYEAYAVLDKNVFKEYKCPVCSYTSNRVGHFHRHFVNVHKDAKDSAEDLWKCGLCDFETKKKAMWTQHKKTHEKPYLCEHCPKRFGNRKNLRDHVLIHQGVKPNQCPYCPYVTIQKRSLEEHIRKHTGECLQCDKCSFTTIYSAAMKMHILAKHTDKSLHPCSQCEYVTNDRSSLSKHMQLHRKRKEFRCSSCKFEGVTKHDVIRHMRCHTQEKVYYCDRCDFSTAYSTAFKNHMMVHYDLKPYKCSLCGYGANQKAKVVTHFRHKHEGTYCGVIDMGVKLKIDLKKYRRTYGVPKVYEVHEEVESVNIQDEDNVDVFGIKTVALPDFNEDENDALSDALESNLQPKTNRPILPKVEGQEHRYVNSHPISFSCLSEPVATKEGLSLSVGNPGSQPLNNPVENNAVVNFALPVDESSIVSGANIMNSGHTGPDLCYNVYKMTESGQLEMIHTSDLQGTENVVVLTESGGQGVAPILAGEDVTGYVQ